MREIKFSYLYENCEGVCEVILGIENIEKGEAEHEEGYKLIARRQFTGLKDKNGKEIYEGDIVKAASQGHVANCLVKWGQGRVGFFLHRESPSICWSLSGGGDKYDQEIVEVIGNIYQNPELLEAGK